MINASRPDAQDTPPDPEQVRFGAHVPARMTEVLRIVQALATYGHHLFDLINHPVLWRGFVTVAQFFGTVETTDIIARIRRGITRATALQSMLERRAQRGRDLVVLAPRTRKDPSPPHEAAKPHPSAPRHPPLTHSTFPTAQDIETEVRRRPIGRTIAAICLDLGISPTLCAGPFWHRLFEAMQDYQGSLIAVMSELRRRQERFEREDWKRQKLPWPERTREGVRQVLGFFIGEDSLPPAPAALTGPS